MPLDPMISTPILSAYRNIVAECKEKQFSGEVFDTMCEAFARIEMLANEHNDVVAFMMQMQKEELGEKITNSYTKLLLEQSKNNSTTPMSDEAMLKQLLDAYRNSIQVTKETKLKLIEDAKNFDPEKAHDKGFDYYMKQHGANLTDANGNKYTEKQISGFKEEGREGIREEIKNKPKAYDTSNEVDVLFDIAKMTKPTEDIIKLGEEPGMTYPRFLRLLIERGLDRALEGYVAIRQTIEEEYKDAIDTTFHISHSTKIEYAKKRLETFNEIAKKSPLQIPNGDELSFQMQKIDRDYEVVKTKLNIIEQDFYSKIIGDIDMWALAYTPLAPYIEPWAVISDMEKRLAIIIRDQKILPGMIQQRLILLQKYFNMSFYDLFKTEAYKLNILNYEERYSQELTEFLIEEVFPICLPFQDLPQNLIDKRTQLYKENKDLNPEIHIMFQRNAAKYDAKFGAGEYVQRFGTLPPAIDSNARPWNWESFKYK